MKQIWSLLITFLISGSFNIPASPFIYNCQDSGSTVIFYQNDSVWYFTDSLDAMRPSLPASTFKVINLAIALELDIVKNENELFTYKGNHNKELYGERPELFQDLTVKEAFRKSAIWVFLEIAEEVGTERYLQILDSCNYGNQQLKGKGQDFWNFGSFAISPYDQVKFLRDFFNHRLPFSERTVGTVKKVMLRDESNGFKIYGKTGWSRDHGINNGWWIGFVEKDGHSWYFATRIERPRSEASKGFSQCRKNRTWQAFEMIGINIE